MTAGMVFRATALRHRRVGPHQPVGSAHPWNGEALPVSPLRESGEKLPKLAGITVHQEFLLRPVDEILRPDFDGRAGWWHGDLNVHSPNVPLQLDAATGHRDDRRSWASRACCVIDHLE